MQHPRKMPEKRRIGKKAAIIATCVLAALAAALVLLLPAIREAHPKESLPPPVRENETRVLQTHDAGELQSVTITHSDGESYTLLAENGALKLDNGDGLAAISEYASDEITLALGHISAVGVVADDAADVEENLADMGLAPPRAVAVLRYTDGSEARLELGGKVYGTTYSYFRWSGDEGVYMCDVGIEDALMYTAARLLPVEQPVLDKTLVDRVTLGFARGGVIDMQFSVDGEGAVSGRLLSPCDYPMSADAAQAALNAVCNLRIGTPISETDADNGFGSPMLVIDAHRRAGIRGSVDQNGQLTYEELPEASFRFTLGRESGDYFYTCRYENADYLVSRFLCQPLVHVDIQSLATRNPAAMDAEPTRISVVTASGELNAHIERTERVLPNNRLETDAEGNTVYDVHAVINGEQVDEAQYNALVDGLAGMTVSGALEEGWSPEGTKPRWQITLTCADGKARVLAGYPLDTFSDALTVDGQALHYINIEALKIALGELMP